MLGAGHLRIIDHIVETVGTIHQHCRTIARQDPDLSKQLKRAINSVGLDAGEASARAAATAPSASKPPWHAGAKSSSGSASGAPGYLDPQRVAREVDNVDRIVATLYRLAYRPV